MIRTALLGTVTLSLLIPCMAVAEIVVPSRTAGVLQVRLYSSQGRDVPSLAALSLATSLLDQAGIAVRWTQCELGRSNELCALPLSTSELAVRLVRDTASHGRSGAPVPLGTSFVDTKEKRGSLATLYVDRTEALAAWAGIACDVILARAIAHEVAHLVLGTNEHGSRGLMRPLWSREMLLHESARAWAFTPEDSKHLQEAMARRTGD